MPALRNPCGHPFNRNLNVQIGISLITSREKGVHQIFDKCWNGCFLYDCIRFYIILLIYRNPTVKPKVMSLNGRINPSSEFVSSSIPSWQILIAHAQPFRGARDLVFCLKVPLDSLLVWASSGGSGETARMRRLAWTFAARISDKYQIRLSRTIYQIANIHGNSSIILHWLHVPRQTLRHTVWRIFPNA